MSKEIWTLLEYLAGPLVTRHDKSPKDREGGIVDQTKRLWKIYTMSIGFRSWDGDSIDESAHGLYYS